MTEGKIDLDLFNKPSAQSGNSLNFDSLSYGIIVAILVMITIFLMIAVNDIWIFVGTSFLVSAYLIYDGQYKVSLIFAIVAILITVWQFFINPKLSKKTKCKNPSSSGDLKAGASCPSELLGGELNSSTCPSDTIENFYTLFTPFHREANAMAEIDTTALSGRATKLWKVRRKPLILGGFKGDVAYINMLSRLLLSRARILDIEIKWEDDPVRMIRDLKEEKIDLAVAPAPIIEQERDEGLRFIANIAHYYLFCISSITSGVQNIYQLKGRRIGIPKRLKGVWDDISGSILPSGSAKIFFKDDDQLFQDLKNFQIDAFFWAGTYPNEFIDGVILSSLSHRYQLVPVLLTNEKAFVKEHIQYSPITLDLSNKFLPSRYLPTGLGRIWMTDYTAQYLTLMFDLSLICNKKLDNFTGYEIAKTIFGGRKLLARHMNQGSDTDIKIDNYTAQTWKAKYDPLTPADIARPSLPEMLIQDGVKKFYVEKGMVSYCQEPGCMQTIGIERCILCDNKVRKTEMQWRDQLIAEKTIPKHYVAVPFKEVWDRNS